MFKFELIQRFTVLYLANALGLVVRRLDSAIQWIVIFSNAEKCLKIYKIADMDLATDKGKV